ncbi:MAG: hypothetical protein ACJAW4_003573 [Paracoccaceae bacterium]|jgi:hypothetical protein
MWSIDRLRRKNGILKDTSGGQAVWTKWMPKAPSPRFKVGNDAGVFKHILGALLASGAGNGAIQTNDSAFIRCDHIASFAGCALSERIWRLR